LLRVPLLAALATSAAAPAAAAQTVSSPNVLDRQVSDLAVLDTHGDAATPLLMVLDPTAPAPSSARLSVLRREDAWTPVATRDIDLAGDGLDARWLIGLGDGRFALIATSPRTAPGTGRAVVVALDVESHGDAVTIDEVDRQGFDRAIEDAGAADVDGFGSAELVLGMRPLYEPSGSCGTSSLVVVDGSLAGIRRRIDLPGRLAAGVVGRFDAQPGEDLLVYSSADCPPGGTTVARLTLIRLSDGVQTRAIRDLLHLDPTAYPPPVRVDLDGSAPDEVIARRDGELSFLDPSDSWRSLRIAGSGSVPLAGGPSVRPEVPGVRVALFDGAGAGALVTGRLGRDAKGAAAWEAPSTLPAGTFDPDRWAILAGSVQAAATHEKPANAWLGDALDVGCPDLLVPGAILPCGTDELRAGPAWLATRPVAAIQVEGQRILLIAAGLAWDPRIGLPEAPTPWASGPAGWWRHGPSTPFALGEIGLRDLGSFLDVPTSAVAMEATATRDGGTEVAGSAGARLFTTIVPLAERGNGLPVAPTAFDALTAGPARGGRWEVVRMPVPSGSGSERDGPRAPLMLGDLRLADGQPASGWAMQIVPVNDWGEWGEPVAQTIIRDAVDPAVALDAPFTSAPWPFYMHLAGRAEPGTSVVVDGIGDVPVDRNGGFAIDAQLAPWPQAFRVTATDPAGNVAVREFSIVGGVDYRRFPWPGIAAGALLALVAARGMFGGGRDRATRAGSTRRSSGTPDDGSTPEIEELPPGSGLARG
jgi:hypothetical protein